MRVLRLLAAAFVLLLGTGTAARAEVIRTGYVTDVSDDAVDINGERLLITSTSRLMSEGREVSVGSLRPGMAATAEADDAGRLILLEVNGVVE